MSGNENDVCPRCNNNCSDGGALSCGACDYFYHFGDCSGVAESTFKTKGESCRKAWNCPTCRAAKSRGSQSGRSKKESDDNVASILVGINEKLEKLMTLKNTVESIEQSVQLMSDQYDELLVHVRHQDKEKSQIKKRVDILERREQSGGTHQLMQDVNDLEWQSRKLNLEFHGIPVSENEDLLSKVNDVASKINVPELGMTDVVSIHRLPAARDKVPGIIVRFARQSVKDAFLAKKSELNRLKIYCFILENLTKRNKVLLTATKDWARNHDYKYVWHKNGRIYIRQKDGERAIIVRNESDLDEIV